MVYREQQVLKETKGIKDQQEQELAVGMPKTN
jgi:hypothetical protein